MAAGAMESTGSKLGSALLLVSWILATLLLLLLQLLTPHDLAASTWQHEIAATATPIESLSADNAELKVLREQIADNLRSVARSGELAHPLRYYRYQLAGGENFFQAMARLSQDMHTLISLNQLPGPASVGSGDMILVPNARGRFDSAGRFDPGGRLGAEELGFFRGDGFLNPLPGGRLTSDFGRRRDPFTNRETFHGGVDIAAPTGTAVLASRRGRVVFAGRAGGYGKLVILEHEYGYRTLYGHLSRIDVVPGSTLQAGESLGAVGATGRATGPHLHFEVRRNGERIRPELLQHRPN